MAMLAPLLTALLSTLLSTLLSGSLGPLSPAPASPRAVWPLDPRPEVVRRFDPPVSRWGAGHRGVDLRGTAGQPVRAAEPGAVSFAGRIAGRGVVVVDHGATRTTYEPVEATVSVGDPVRAGDVVGRLALAGSHCFPAACLHWGLIAGADTYLDPLALLGAGPVRLLPLTGPLTGPLSGLLSGPLPGSPAGMTALLSVTGPARTVATGPWQPAAATTSLPGAGRSAAFRLLERPGSPGPSS